jgi:molybdate transport system substrate-binding protein
VRRFGFWLPLATVMLALAACGGGGNHEGEATGASDSTLTVYAAASLTEVLPKIDPTPDFNFAGSDELATQIREGAPADVYAAANAKYPAQLYDEAVVEEPVVFASNRLVLIVPKGNPAEIERVQDVLKPETKLVVAAEGVPVGDYARKVLGTLKLSDALENVVSNEEDVKGVASKVALGEADAGFVYATDVTPVHTRVRVIELPAGSQPPIEYELAVVAASENKQAAQAFVERVLGASGREALEAAGFVIPYQSLGPAGAGCGRLNG